MSPFLENPTNLDSYQKLNKLKLIPDYQLETLQLVEEINDRGGKISLDLTTQELWIEETHTPLCLNHCLKLSSYSSCVDNLVNVGLHDLKSLFWKKHFGVKFQPDQKKGIVKVKHDSVSFDLNIVGRNTTTEAMIPLRPINTKDVIPDDARRILGGLLLLPDPNWYQAVVNNGIIVGNLYFETALALPETVLIEADLDKFFPIDKSNSNRLHVIGMHQNSRDYPIFQQILNWGILNNQKRPLVGVISR